MKPRALLPYYEKLEGLMRRLPAPLQKPILRELTPIKELFLMQRPPRILVLGQHGTVAETLVRGLFGTDAEGKFDPGAAPGWKEYSAPNRGRLLLLDGRPSGGAALDLIRAGLVAAPPDALLFLRETRGIDPGFAQDIDHAAQLAETLSAKPTHPLLGVQLAPGSEEDRLELHASLLAKPPLAARLTTTVWVGGTDGFGPLARALSETLPGEAQLEMARVTADRDAQKHIARTLVRSNTAICAALGAQPIPFADLPFLIAIQTAMVAGIVYVSGRPIGPKTVAEFTGALGANLGLGVVLREASRGLLKFFPGWGNAISGLLAGAGTYALGRAATAYFIDGVHLDKARLIFRKTKAPRKIAPPPEPPSLPGSEQDKN